MTTRTTAAADGVALTYDLSVGPIGPEGGPPRLVFVHGWCGDRTVWDPVLSALGARYPTLRLDLAGHGDSRLGRRRYTMPAFGDDVARCVEAAGPEEVFLIGHSMAGEVIVEAALRLGGRVAGLIGVDTLWNVSRELDPQVIEDTLAPFRRDYRQAAEDYVRAMFLPNSNPAIVHRVVADVLSVPAEVGLGALEEILRHRPALRRSLLQLKAPVELLNSAAWRSTDAASAERYGLRVHEVRGVGHFSMLERPRAVAAGIEKIVDRLSASAGTRRLEG
ncbi:MAG: alpha/beta hydrolase [Acidobacteriota bacterium]